MPLGQAIERGFVNGNVRGLMNPSAERLRSNIAEVAHDVTTVAGQVVLVPVAVIVPTIRAFATRALRASNCLSYPVQ